MQPTDKPSLIRANARGLIVVAVLVLILTAVLVVQFAGGAATSSRDGGDAAMESQARQSSQPRARAAAQRTDTRDAPNPWLPIPFERVVGHNPFRMPDVPLEDESSDASPDDEAEDEEDIAEDEAAELRARVEAARQAALAALTEQGVGAFMAGGKDGNVAVIGDQTIRAGDVIDGFRVIAIGPSGVIVEPIE